MKKLILILLAIFTTSSYGFEYSSFHIGESISMHPMAFANASTDKFSNKISNDGMFVLNKPTIDWSHTTVKNGQYNKWTSSKS